MRIIFIIFKKELLDTLRDRRTIIAMVIVPLLLIPVLLSIVSSFQKNQLDKAKAKDLTIAIASNGNATEFVQQLQKRKDIKILEDIDILDFKALIKKDSLDLALEINPSFDKTIQSGATGKINIYYNSTAESVVIERLENAIERYSNQILNTRLEALQTNKAMITPINTSKKDVYTTSESIGKMIGGVLPYIFVLFCFMGSMYPAIDLFTGEKERGTIETILTTPANRLQILLGKMLVVVTAGVLSGLFVIVGMSLAMRLNSSIPPELLLVVQVVLTPSVISLIILMLIPLTIFFSGVLIPASIYSKSFKEAQSIIQPMAIVIILPLVIAMLPSMELNALTATIPIFNVALACKDIIAGTIDYVYLIIVSASLLFFAGISFLICVRWFGEEGNILRT